MKTLFIFTIFLFFSCNAIDTEKPNNTIISENTPKKSANNIEIIQNNLNVKPIKFSHAINTSASEYYPTISPDGTKIIFTGMDRTGYFDYKILFNKSRNNGGEDIFFSNLENGNWQDSRDLRILNTNGHESVNQLFENGDLLITGNYLENLGPTKTDNGANTTDIFLARSNQNFNLTHFDEPVNSIFNEADANMTKDRNTILFVSDRPGHIGDYHKKGWLWNESYWGNTDIYVSTNNGDAWSNPINLGSKINTPYTERTPWLSSDGLTLYIASNGYNTDRKDLNIYYFKRTNKEDWEHWEGPFEITGLNGQTDDWGYQEDLNGVVYFSRANKLDYVPTKRGKDGTGFIFENNYRAGYAVYGQQSGSFKTAEQTDIYFYNNKNIALTIPDLLFEVDSYKLKLNNDYIEKIIDFININNPQKLIIIGYTDSDGTDKHNLELSMNRALEIKSLLIDKNIKANIEAIGKGKDNPIAPNENAQGKSKNRRVEIIFE